MPRSFEKPLAAVFCLLALALSAAADSLPASPASSAPLAPLAPSAGGSQVLISVADQKLVLLRGGSLVAQYPISTSRFGIGDRNNSYRTPLGLLQVAQKIGANAALGAVFKNRRPTGEVLKPNAAGRDPIVTRILWLRGLQAQNANAYNRGIYIHGTPVERNLGTPASYGCIRMRSRDVVEVFDALPVGAPVTIVQTPVRQAVKEWASVNAASAPERLLGLRS